MQPLILAIDPSIVCIGLAVMRGDQLLGTGLIKTKMAGTDRFKEIQRKLKAVIEQHKPDILAIETQYLGGLRGNAVLKTTEVKGLCKGVFLSIVPNGQIYDIVPSEAKQALGLPGGRTKRKDAKGQAIRMVSLMYPKAGVLNDNAADAVGIGLASLAYIQNRK